MAVEYVPEGDLYEVLEIRPDATTENIKAAHRRLIKTYHPDLGGNEAKASALNFARDVLVDPIQRRRYDELRSAYLAMHRLSVPSMIPKVMSPVTAPRTPGVVTEFLADDIMEALRSRNWLGALAMVFAGYKLDEVVNNATARNPVARSAVDALAEWMRAERIDRERDARARSQTRVRSSQVARLHKRVDAVRAAARKPVRKKRDR